MSSYKFERLLIICLAMAASIIPPVISTDLQNFLKLIKIKLPQ